LAFLVDVISRIARIQITPKMLKGASIALRTGRQDSYFTPIQKKANDLFRC